MSDTRALLGKIAALRQRLEQAQGLARDVGADAALLPATNPDPAGRVRRLELHVADGTRHHFLLDNSLRQLPPEEGGPRPETVLPTRLTARASRLLRRGQDLLRQLRTLHNQPLLGDDADPLAVRYRDTAALIDTVLRTVQAFPNAPSAQLRMCEGLEVILGIVEERLAGINAVIDQRRRETGAVDTLAELLTGLAEGKLLDVKPYVVLADAILADAQQAAPLRFLSAAIMTPARLVAAHSFNVAQVAGRVVRHDPDLRGRELDPVLAALVHDVGMLRVPAEIFTHAGPLDEGRRRAVEGHTLTGAEMALRLLPTANWLAEATVGHHERLDGTGYPSGLRDVQIGHLTRLLSVCDVYAALCAPRAHRPAAGTRTALTDTLLLAEQGLLDRFHTEKLLHLSFYPVGTVVELADGAVGVVVATHQNRRDLNTPARPVLALLTDPQRQTLPAPRHVDLAECEGHSIVRSLPAEERRQLLGKRYPELV
jgi:HD-GYP domain-containing protein (c-di-GMP phosphodiesterase class II)